MSTVQDCPDTGMQFIDCGDGCKRYLASIPSGGKMRAMLPGYEAAGNPVFDKKDWFELSRRGGGGVYDHVFDQGQHGSCVGHGWASALMKARASRGMKQQILSPTYLYSLINGNRDQGAVISDGIEALQTVGTCLFSTVGENRIYQSQMPAGARAEAARFKLGAAYHCASWAEAISAVLTGLFFPVFGLQVGNNFMRFDRYGVAGHDRGPGNHCLHGDGVKYLPDGRWVIDVPNSWGTSFGDGGRLLMDEDHLFAGGDQPDLCVVRAPSDDPQDALQPPAAQP